MLAQHGVHESRLYTSRQDNARHCHSRGDRDDVLSQGYVRSSLYLFSCCCPTAHASHYDAKKVDHPCQGCDDDRTHGCVLHFELSHPIALHRLPSENGENSRLPPAEYRLMCTSCAIFRTSQNSPFTYCSARMYDCGVVPSEERNPMEDPLPT